MVFGDRNVPRVRRHLKDGEVLVSSVAGVEADGRRRRLVVVTDRRICISWFRGGPPVEFGLEGAEAEFDPTGRLLTVRQGDEEVMLRDVDEMAARALVELLSCYRHRSPRPAPVLERGA